MAYADQSKRAHPAAVTAAILLQGAAIYALIHGFAVSFIPEVTSVFSARNIAIETPPTPRPQPSVRPKKDTIQPRTSVDRTITPLSNANDVVFTEARQIPIDPVDVKLPDFLPPPDPSPSFTPRLARPRNSPTNWATTNDYPARDLREGNQGTARFLLTIGANGRVESCRITETTGSASLDDATCRNVSRRAQFDPATDGSGARVGGTYSGSIRWVIPRD